jgi:predicted dehydrogenase
MTKESYRAAIVGLGMIGGADPVSADALGQKVENMDGTHAGAYQKNPRIKIVAGATRDAGRRQRFEARTGAKTYPDWREMIERESLDIVSVATYSPAHAEITIACAKRGIPVIYCEKPVATRLADAEQMLEACKRSKTLLVFNHQRRFDPNHRRLQRAIAEGRLGDLTSAHLQWATGRLGNVGTHVIDGLLMLTRRRFLGVSATLDLSGKPDCRGADFHDPGAWGVLRLEGGLMATVNAPDYAKTPFYTEINGTKGRAYVRGLAVTVEGSDGRSENWPAASDGITSMDRAVAEIIDHLDQKAPFPCVPDEAVHAFEAIVSFHASHARNSAWTNLPLAGKDREIEVQTG